MVSASAVNACDVCGCITSDMGFGFIPVQNNSIIGLNFNFTAYKTSHSTGLNTFETSKDQFLSTSLWGRYGIKDKILLQASLPYQWSTVQMQDETYNNHGIGDLTVLAYFQVLSFQHKTKPLKIRWLAGSGIKAPTANFEKNHGALYIQNIQNGSGSWDVPLGSNLAIISKNVGFNNETNYRFNGHNRLNFKYGNSLSSRSIVFYRKMLKGTMLIP